MNKIIGFFVILIFCVNVYADDAFEKSREVIENYVVIEILNGRKYEARLSDKNGVIDIYGKPLEDNIIAISPFNFEGGNVVGLRELIYNDLKHTYYVFESGSQIYAYVEIVKSNARLKTINIGDTIDKLISTFGNNYYKGNKENVSYYGLNEEVIFVIENNIIKKIICNYLLI